MTLASLNGKFLNASMLWCSDHNDWDQAFTVEPVLSGRRGGSVVSSSPGQCYHVGILGKTLSQCLSLPRCINGNQQIVWGHPDKMLGCNLRWTSIPSRDSRFILHKTEISAGTDEPSGSPSYDWGRLYLY